MTLGTFLSTTLFPFPVILLILFSVPTNTCSFLIFSFQPDWSLCDQGFHGETFLAGFSSRKNQLLPSLSASFFLLLPSPPPFPPSILPPFLSFLPHKYLLISFQTLQFPKHDLCKYNSSPGHSGIRYRDTTSYLQMMHELVLPYLGCRIQKTAQAWEGIFKAVRKRLNEL